jgi:hypothetical protein
MKNENEAGDIEQSDSTSDVDVCVCPVSVSVVNWQSAQQRRSVI